MAFGLDSLSTAKSILGPKLGSRLTRPLSNFNQLTSRVKSLSTIFTGIPGSDLQSNVDEQNSNEFTRQNTLEAIQSREDPQLSVDWVAYIVDNSNDLNLPWFYIDTLQLPSLTIEASPIFRNGRTHFYAGSAAISQMTLGLYTDISGKSLSAVSSWAAQVYDAKHGTYQVPAAYKKTIKVWLYDARRRVVCEFAYYGCWPTSYNGYNLEATGSTPLLTTLELSVDSMSINTIDADGFTTAGAAGVSDSINNPLASIVQGGFNKVSETVNRFRF